MTFENEYYHDLAKKLLRKASVRKKVKTRPSKRLVEALIEIGGDRDVAIKLVLKCIFNDMLPGYSDLTPEMKSKEENDISAFKYVPSSRARFVQETLTHFLSKKNFIDVGSGYADKVALAHEYGSFDCVNGIEMNQFTYNVSLFLLDRFYGNDILRSGDRHTTQWDRHSIVLTRGNAFDYDFSEHDAVYMYMPIHDRRILERLHIHVLNTMPKGGMLYEDGGGWFNKRGRAKGDKYARAIDWNDNDYEWITEQGGEIFTYEEYTERYFDTPLKRKIRISHHGHVVTVLE